MLKISRLLGTHHGLSFDLLFKYLLKMIRLSCARAQAKLIKLVDDVIVESYSKNMELDNMKVPNAGTFGEYPPANDGSSAPNIPATQR